MWQNKQTKNKDGGGRDSGCSERCRGRFVERVGIWKEEGNEVGEDTTKYGEFISTYFAWVPLREQKEKVEKMEKITSEQKEEKK